jgi:outer membrane protein assembly factor BamD (BamD/ComL family)
MKRTVLFSALLAVILLMSCSPSKTEMIKKIDGMEAGLRNAGKADTAVVTNIIGAYQNFASRFPEDSLSPDYLYKAAAIAAGFQRGTQAIDLYESILTKYPNYKRTPECIFMQAFTYENVIGDIAKASEMYNKFLFRYPNHDLADDAQSAIKFLGKSPEEMVKEFEKMNADSAAASAK